MVNLYISLQEFDWHQVIGHIYCTLLVWHFPLHLCTFSAYIHLYIVGHKNLSTESTNNIMYTSIYSLNRQNDSFFWKHLPFSINLDHNTPPLRIEVVTLMYFHCLWFTCVILAEKLNHWYLKYSACDALNSALVPIKWQQLD